jgi:hypothetical protein
MSAALLRHLPGPGATATARSRGTDLCCRQRRAGRLARPAPSVLFPQTTKGQHREAKA